MKQSIALSLATLFLVPTICLADNPPGGSCSAAPNPINTVCPYSNDCSQGPQNREWELAQTKCQELCKTKKCGGGIVIYSGCTPSKDTGKPATYNWSCTCKDPGGVTGF